MEDGRDKGNRKDSWVIVGRRTDGEHRGKEIVRKIVKEECKSDGMDRMRDR